MLCMFKYDAYDCYSYNRYFAFNATYEFGVEQNMTYAFGLASKRSLNFTENLEDYGQVKAFYESWSINDTEVVFEEV